MAGVRHAVLWVPDWPIVAAGMEGSCDPATPCAVHDGRGLLVASSSARAAGVRTGMRRRQAQRACPEIALLAADEERDARAFEAVVQAVEGVVAFPVVLRPGLLLVDSAGPVRHHGSEEVLAAGLVGAVAAESGSESYVGIADGLLGAVMAARGGVIVPEGGSPDYLAPHSVDTLRHAAYTKAARAEVQGLVEVLVQLGLTRLGHLAALPLPDVAGRFGALGIRAHALARGEAVPTAPGARPVGAVVVSRELDPPLERSDAAAFAARTLAEELATRLRGRACGKLRVTARTTDGTELSRLWTIEGPLSASEATDRVRWQLDGWLSGRSGRPPSAPLHGLELVAEEVRGAGSASDPLWGRAGAGELAARRAMVRLQGMLGVDGVARPVLEGGRDPRTRVRMVTSGDEETPRRRTDAPWPGRLPSPSPSTVYDEPRAAELTDEAGRAVVVDARGGISASPAWVAAGESRRAVVAWAGPWPISERWWDAPRRAAWLQVTAEEGPSLLLSCAGGTWQVEGAYD
ncbi:MAG: DNA polymerase Y family protein [bacterium]|nr:DNA polymerase Y family protein [bacterium]